MCWPASRRRPPPPPPSAVPLPRASRLGHAHISQSPAFGHSSEVGQSVVKRNWSWRSGGFVAIPASELSDDPGGPSETFRPMGIFLELGLSFQGLVESKKGIDLTVVERQGDGLVVATVTRLHELDDGGGSFGRNGNKPFQTLCGLKFAVLDLQALALQYPEELLDDPSLLVPSDNFPCVGDCFDPMCREQQPMHGLDAFGRVLLDDLDEPDTHAFGQIFFQRVLGPFERDRSKPQRESDLSGLSVCSLTQFQCLPVDDGWKACRLTYRSTLNQSVIASQAR